VALMHTRTNIVHTCMRPPPQTNTLTQGKPEAIARIRQSQPYNTIVMIGDGITDLEAVQVVTLRCSPAGPACPRPRGALPLPGWLQRRAIGGYLLQ
jgi:hypothetical protein